MFKVHTGTLTPQCSYTGMLTLQIQVIGRAFVLTYDLLDINLLAPELFF